MNVVTRRSFVQGGLGAFAVLAADGAFGAEKRTPYGLSELERRYSSIGFDAYAIARADDAAGRLPPAFPLNAFWEGAETDRGKSLLNKIGDIPGFKVVQGRDAADAVICTADPTRHAEIAIAALREGKPVYLDPPIGLDAAERAAVERAAAESKGLCYCADRYAASTCYRPGLEAIRAGAIGEVREAWVGDCGLPQTYVQLFYARAALGVTGDPADVKRTRNEKGEETLRAVWADGKALTLVRTADAVRRKVYCIARVFGSKGKMMFNADDRSMQFDSSDVLVRYWWGRDPERTAFAGSLPVPRRDLDLRTLAHFAACVHERALQPYVTLAALSEMCRWQERLWGLA